MRLVCAKKESALGLRGAIPGSEALDRKGLADLASEKEPGAGVCRLLEVESEGAAFGERASAIGEADRRDGTLVCLALMPARGTNISAPSTRAPAIGRPTSTVTPCRKRVAVAFCWKRDNGHRRPRLAARLEIDSGDLVRDERFLEPCAASVYQPSTTATEVDASRSSCAPIAPTIGACANTRLTSSRSAVRSRRRSSFAAE
jgi:hypothetical protein